MTINRFCVPMNELEEINRRLEEKAKALEDEILQTVEHNNRLRCELDELRREEHLTLAWLASCSKDQ